MARGFAQRVKDRVGLAMYRMGIKMSNIARADLQVRALDQWDEDGGPTRRVLKLADAFREISWVFTANSAIAKGVMSVPPILRKRNATDKPGESEYEIVKAHPILDIINKPNGFMAWGDLMEAWNWNLYQHGHALLEKVRAAGGQGNTVALYYLRSKDVEFHANPVTLFDFITYAPNNRGIKIPRDDIVYVRFFNPDSDLRGFTPLESIQHPIGVDKDAQRHVDASFDNDATPGLALETDKDLSEATINRLYRMLESRHSGPNRAKLPMILHSGLKANPVGATLRDMDFTGLRRMNREEILGVHGVPPIMGGILEGSSYSNARLQERIFIGNTLIPLCRKLYGAINRDWVQKEYGAEYELIPFFDDILMDAEERGRKQTEATQLFSSNLITLDEAREHLGRPKVGEDRGGSKFQRELVVAASPFLFSADGKASGGPGLGRPTPMQKRRFDPEDVVEFVKGRNDAARRAEPRYLAFAIDLFRAQMEAAVHVTREAVTKTARDSLLEVLKSGAGIGGNGNGHSHGRSHGWKCKAEGDKPVPEDRVMRALKEIGLTLDEVAAGREGELQEIIRMTARDGAQETIRTTGIGVSFNLFDPRVSKFVEARGGDLISKINDTTKGKVQDALKAALEEGAGTDEIEEKIREAFGDALDPSNRPAAIARTETAAATNFASVESFRQGGIRRKEWLTTPDDLVREAHAEAEGQIVGVDEPFTVGGEQLMFPADTSLGASAGMVIGCRCVAIGVIE